MTTGITGARWVTTGSCHRHAWSLRRPVPASPQPTVGHLTSRVRCTRRSRVSRMDGVRCLFSTKANLWMTTLNRNSGRPREKMALWCFSSRHRRGLWGRLRRRSSRRGVATSRTILYRGTRNRSPWCYRMTRQLCRRTSLPTRTPTPRTAVALRSKKTILFVLWQLPKKDTPGPRQRTLALKLSEGFREALTLF